MKETMEEINEAKQQMKRKAHVGKFTMTEDQITQLEISWENTCGGAAVLTIGLQGGAWVRTQDIHHA